VALDGIDLESAISIVRALAQATLALVMVCDASRLDLGHHRRQIGVLLHLIPATSIRA
jgi:hypothetical protein